MSFRVVQWRQPLSRVVAPDLTGLCPGSIAVLFEWEMLDPDALTYGPSYIISHNDKHHAASLLVHPGAYDSYAPTFAPYRSGGRATLQRR